jgi:23S rRNA (guanosine2251-2'-O)-methyltransferase
MPAMKKHACAVLVDVRSSHNVGSMFRTADALGIEKMFLVGYTPAPVGRFGKVNVDIAKTALGAESSVAWEQVESPTVAIKKLKAEGYEVVAIEQSEKAADYKTFSVADVKGGKIAFVFGNEVDGLDAKTLAACDRVLEIPMRGKKESLNVSVSFGIALARILDL